MKPQLLNFLLLLSLCTLTLPAAHAQGPEPYWEQIRSLEKDERWTDALVLTERLIEAEPGNARLQRKRASLNFNRGERVLAIVQMREILAQDPTNDTSLSNIGWFYEYSGMLDSALSSYNRALRFSKSAADSFDNNLNIGNVYNHQQRFDVAIAHFEGMRKTAPKSAEVLANLGQSYARSGQKEKAAELLELVLRQDSSAVEFYNNLGLLYTEMNRLPEAKAVFERGIARTPKDAVILNNYGHLLGRLKLYPQALLQINKSIALYPSNAFAYRNSALVYLDMKLMKEACADLHASEELGFKMYYGDEVEQLMKQHCR